MDLGKGLIPFYNYKDDIKDIDSHYDSSFTGRLAANIAKAGRASLELPFLKLLDVAGKGIVKGLGKKAITLKAPRWNYGMTKKPLGIEGTPTRKALPGTQKPLLLDNIYTKTGSKMNHEGLSDLVYVDGDMNLPKNPEDYKLMRLADTVDYKDNIRGIKGGVLEKSQYPEINPEKTRRFKYLAEKFEQNNPATFDWLVKSDWKGVSSRKPKINLRTMEKTYNKVDLHSTPVGDFRQYLRTQGIDPKDVTDNQLASIIEANYKNLNNSMTGDAKGSIFWHGSDKAFDTFNWRNNLGNYTSNNGGAGVGNNFSLTRQPYGTVKNPITNNGIVYNMQPYMLNDINGFINIDLLRKEGMAPPYVSTNEVSGSALESAKKMFAENKKLPEENYLSVNSNGTFSTLSKLLPSKSAIPIKDESGNIFYRPNLEVGSEFVLRRNSGIKSLFNDIDAFYMKPDGSVGIKRDWNDPRVNFKYGGKL